MSKRRRGCYQVTTVVLGLCVGASLQADESRCRALISQLNAAIENVSNGGESGDVVPDRGGATSSTTVKKVITIEELLTFQAVGRGLGFGAEPKKVAAKRSDIEEILKATKGEQKRLLEVAEELNFYFQNVPFDSVFDAWGLVALRSTLDVTPEEAIQTYDLVHQLLSNDSPKALPFVRNSSVGLSRDYYLEITHLLLTVKNLDIEKFESMLEDVEAAFSHHRVPHQVTVVMSFIKMQKTKPNIRWSAYLNATDLVLRDLNLTKAAIGFGGETVVRPNLKEAVTLVALGKEAGLNKNEILEVSRAIILKTKPKTFNEVIVSLYQMTQKLKSEHASSKS